MTATVTGHTEVCFTYSPCSLQWPPQPGSGSSLPSSSGRRPCCQQAWHWGSGVCRAAPASQSVNHKCWNVWNSTQLHQQIKTSVHEITTLTQVFGEITRAQQCFSPGAGEVGLSVQPEPCDNSQHISFKMVQCVRYGQICSLKHSKKLTNIINKILSSNNSDIMSKTSMYCVRYLLKWTC